MKRLFVLMVAALAAAPLFATPRTWTGTSSNLWSVGANWGGTAPVPGDDLLFPAGASNLATSNDFPAGTSFNSITFTGAASYTISGNAITIGSGGVTNSASFPAIQVPVTLGVSQAWFNNGAVVSFTSVNLNGQSLNLNASTGNIAINGIISGSGTITKSGNGLSTLSGSNTFSGQLLISAGTLVANSANAFGVADNTTANGTIIAVGAQLQLVSPFSYPTEEITVNGSGLAGSGGAVTVLGSSNVTLAGTVRLGTNVGMNLVGTSLTFNGILTGSGRLGMSGNGAFVLGNAGNNFTGGVAWGAGGTTDSTLVLNVDNALPASVSLDIGSSGFFNVNSKTQSITSLAGDGAVTLGSGTPGNLTITNPPSVSFDGTLNGTGNVTVTGGSITFTGSNVFTGTFTNAGGATSFANASINAPITQTSGTLGIASAEQTGAVTINGGSLVPGFGGSGIGFTGNLALAAAGAYDEVIAGTSSGLFGLLHVTGTVNLGGASLLLSGTGTGVGNGTQIKMIDNDGSDPVAGTFAGLPQGGVISGGPGGFNYVISYTGGDGNDIVLTAVSSGLAATTTTLTNSPNPSALGASVTLTANVTSGVPGTPTGTVTFFDGASNIGTAPLSGGVATFSTSALTAGSHLLSATYSGDATFAGGASIPNSQTVNAVATTSTTVTSSTNPSVLGANVTFTATVASSGSPTGTVSFFDGLTLLGTGSLSGGVATFSTSALTAGAHNITASYGGDANNAASTSLVLVQNVIAAVPALDPRLLAALAVVLALIAAKVART